MYLFVATLFFVFTACGGGENKSEEATQSLGTSTEILEVSSCDDECQKACCLGCHATEGEAVCLADHSCCTAHEEVTEEAHDHGVEGHSHE